MYYGSEFAGAMAAFAGFMIIIALVVLGCYVLFYILRSLGLYTLAQRRGLPNPWMAWIPVAGWYTMGAIADDINEKEGSSSFFRWLLLGGSILSTFLPSVGGVFSMISAITDPYGYEGLFAASGAGALGSLVSLAFLVISLIALNKIFKCYKPESSTAWTVLCVFFAFLRSIFPFVIRNNPPNWINGPAPQGDYYAPQQGGWQPNTPPPADAPWQQQAPPAGNEPQWQAPSAPPPQYNPAPPQQPEAPQQTYTPPSNPYSPNGGTQPTTPPPTDPDGPTQL